MASLNTKKRQGRTVVDSTSNALPSARPPLPLSAVESLYAAAFHAGLDSSTSAQVSQPVSISEPPSVEASSMPHIQATSKDEKQLPPKACQSPLAFFSTSAGERPPRSLSDPKPPVVVRSNPERETRETIDWFRDCWPHECNSIFAKSSDGHSRWDITWFFDEYDFHVFGGEFCYNLILTMQKQNEANALHIARDWSQRNKAHYPWMPNVYMGIEAMFAEPDRERYGDEFLRVCLRLIRAAMDEACDQKVSLVAKPLQRSSKSPTEMGYQSYLVQQADPTTTLVLSGYPQLLSYVPVGVLPPLQEVPSGMINHHQPLPSDIDKPSHVTQPERGARRGRGNARGRHRGRGTFNSATPRSSLSHASTSTALEQASNPQSQQPQATTQHPNSISILRHSDPPQTASSTVGSPARQRAVSDAWSQKHRREFSQFSPTSRYPKPPPTPKEVYLDMNSSQTGNLVRAKFVGEDVADVYELMGGPIPSDTTLASIRKTVEAFVVVKECTLQASGRSVLLTLHSTADLRTLLSHEPLLLNNNYIHLSVKYNHWTPKPPGLYPNKDRVPNYQPKHDMIQQRETETDVTEQQDLHHNLTASQKFTTYSPQDARSSLNAGEQYSRWRFRIRSASRPVSYLPTSSHEHQESQPEPSQMGLQTETRSVTIEEPGSKDTTKSCEDDWQPYGGAEKPGNKTNKNKSKKTGKRKTNALPEGTSTSSSDQAANTQELSESMVEHPSESADQEIHKSNSSIVNDKQLSTESPQNASDTTETQDFMNLPILAQFRDSHHIHPVEKNAFSLQLPGFDVSAYTKLDPLVEGSLEDDSFATCLSSTSTLPESNVTVIAEVNSNLDFSVEDESTTAGGCSTQSAGTEADCHLNNDSFIATATLQDAGVQPPRSSCSLAELRPTSEALLISCNGPCEEFQSSWKVEDATHSSITTTGAQLSYHEKIESNNNPDEMQEENKQISQKADELVSSSTDRVALGQLSPAFGRKDVTRSSELSQDLSPPARELASKGHPGPSDLSPWLKEYEATYEAIFRIFDKFQRTKTGQELEVIKQSLEQFDQKYNEAYRKSQNATKSSKSKARKSLCQLSEAQKDKLEELVLLNGRVKGQIDSQQTETSKYPAFHGPSAREIIASNEAHNSDNDASKYSTSDRERHTLMEPQSPVSFRTIEDVLCCSEQPNLEDAPFYLILSSKGEKVPSSSRSTLTGSPPITMTEETEKQVEERKEQDYPRWYSLDVAPNLTPEFPPKSPQSSASKSPQIIPSRPLPRTYAAAAAAGAAGTSVTKSSPAVSASSTENTPALPPHPARSRLGFPSSNSARAPSKGKKREGSAEWRVGPEGPWGQGGMHSKNG